MTVIWLFLFLFFACFCRSYFNERSEFGLLHLSPPLAESHIPSWLTDEKGVTIADSQRSSLDLFVSVDNEPVDRTCTNNKSHSQHGAAVVFEVQSISCQYDWFYFFVAVSALYS